jgi:outer membrane protein TolC
VRSEAREAYRRYRSTYDVASQYQREVLPLRQIITEEMQLRLSSMQVDVFALVTEARQRIVSQRAAIGARRAFFVAQSDLQVAVNGGTPIGGGDVQSALAGTSQASSSSH